MNERKEPLVEKLRRVPRLIGSGMQEYHLAGLLTSAADEIVELRRRCEAYEELLGERVAKLKEIETTKDSQ